MIITKKMETNQNGYTVIYDENNIPQEIKIANYPEGTAILERDGNWYIDAQASGFPTEKTEKILAMEELYYATKDLIPYSLYIKATEQYEEYCMKQFEENPYYFLDLDELYEFSDLDKKLVLHKFSYRLLELKYAIRTVLSKNESDGHTCMTYTTFQKKLSSLLRRNGHELDPEHIPAYLTYYKELFYYDGAYVAFAKTHKKEAFVYKSVKKMMLECQYACFWHTYNKDLSDEQNAAVDAIVSGSNISILTGGPGTGKSTTLRDMVSEFNMAYPDKKVVLLAPTGKAARRIKEVFFDLSVSISTIHYFLGFGHKRTQNETERVKDADFIIIDESSMMGVEIFYQLLSCVDLKTVKILLVGDVDQLPSIEPGNVLTDLIELGVKTYYLTKNYRSNSSIHKNATNINAGIPLLDTDENFEIIDVNSAFLNEFIQTLDTEVVLTPYRKEENKNGEMLLGSSITINRMIHEKKYPGIKGYAIGEKIIITHTNYKSGYINGETGEVVNVLPEGVLVQLDNKEKLIQIPDDMTMGHAITTHKAQGSEYEDIVICILKNTGSFFTRQMLYTAVTRARAHVTLLGDTEELATIIANDSKVKKVTFMHIWNKQAEQASSSATPSAAA